jgi:hypothetical protein
MQTEIARLNVQFNKRVARLAIAMYDTKAYMLTTRYQAAVKAERALNVTLSARNQGLSTVVARLRRDAQERDTRDHIRLVKNRRVNEELEEDVDEAHRSAS